MILVVHRNAPLRRLLTTSLSELGHPIVTAPTGECALELMQQHDAHFSLLVSGMVLPGIDGPALAERFRECCGPLTPVIITSAYGRPSEGACDVFLAEPLEVADVVRAARRLIGPQ